MQPNHTPRLPDLDAGLHSTMLPTKTRLSRLGVVSDPFIMPKIVFV